MDKLKEALLIEDDLVLQTQVLRSLAAEGFNVTCAASIQDAMHTLQDTDMSLVICDRGLPDGDGITLIQHLRQSGFDAPILILSALSLPHHRVGGLDAGADDYLCKPFDDGELRARVRSLTRRLDRVTQPRLKVIGTLELHLSAREAHLDGQRLDLRPKAFDLLLYLAEHHGDVVTREMLLSHVWNLDFDPQTNVIDVTIGRLRRKLEAVGSKTLLRTIRGEGYMLDTAAP